MEPQAYTEFQPLKEVLVGRSYDAKFLNSLDVPFTKKTKSLMTYLLDETEEDFLNLCKTLTDLGVIVRRPSIDDYSVSKNMHNLSGAYLMNPRDDQIVIDNKIIMGQWHTSLGQGYVNSLKHYEKSFLPDPAFKNIVCSSIVRLGEDIIIDNNEYANTEKHVNRLKQYFEPLGYNIIFTKTHDFTFKNRLSHTDAVFAILKPGLILHGKSNSEYSEGLFPNWDLIKADFYERLGNSKIYNEFLALKQGYKQELSYAFEDDKYNDDSWFNLLNNWFSTFIGYSKETQFDVNCLVIDEENVIFSSYNKKIFHELEKRKINPIICPFRHRLFWDGGIHCITLDLKREGPREKYL